MHVQDRRIFAAGRSREAVGKARHQHARGRVVGVDVDAAAFVQEKPAQVVDAVGVVGVLVAVEHGIDPIDIGVDELVAEIRSGIDQHARDAVCTAPLDQQRAAPPPVLRVAGIACAPAGAGPRHAARGAAAENREGQAHAAAAAGRGTLENNLKKFSVVWRAISSGVTPRTSASTLATSDTYAGSLRLPRYGIGARYGASVSIRKRSAGTSLAIARRSAEFLKVTMPVNEM